MALVPIATLVVQVDLGAAAHSTGRAEVPLLALLVVMVLLHQVVVAVVLALLEQQLSQVVAVMAALVL
jgi:hypothetical protein